MQNKKNLRNFRKGENLSQDPRLLGGSKKKCEWIVPILACLLSSCAIGPHYLRPATPAPAAFKEAAKPVQGPLTEAAMKLAKAQPKDEAPRGKWWEVFGDTTLNALEAQVAVNNQNVKAAEAAFRQARALVGETRSGYFPTLGVNASATRSSTGAGTSSVPGATLAGAVHNTYSASLDVSWVPDLWGRIRREVESSKAGAQASAADLASATLSAQGELAIDYLGLRLADEQKRLLDRSVAEFSKSLQLTQNQYNAGIVSHADVLQAKVQLENTQAQAADIGVQRAQFEHAIAVLTGKAPADFSVAAADLILALPEIPRAIPSQLLERRPDIAAAERRVVAANAQIGVAEAAFFPDITLSAAGGYASSELARWFILPNRFWSIGPSLVETLFDAGLRAAQTEAAIAAYDQTVATYRQTVLASFQGVEDNLAALRILAQEAEVLDAAVKDAKASAEVSLNQYKAGTVSYLSVVTVQTSELNSELTALNVRRQRLIAAATLIENLGGGWNAGVLKKPEVTQGEVGPFTLLPPGIKR